MELSSCFNDFFLTANLKPDRARAQKKGIFAAFKQA